MKFAVLDFETTGTQSVGEIIQVGLAIIEEDGTISRVYGSYVKPGAPIPPFITGLTGITDSDVQDAPELDEMMMELVPLLDDVVLVGHNVAFDFHFLQNALDRCGYLPFQGRILDTIDFLKICFPSLSTYQLGAVSSHFGITHDRPHQADSDALATAIVLLKCLEELQSLPLLTIQRLNELFADEDSDLAWYFDGLLREREMETFQPEGELSFYRQLALAVGDWAELATPREDGSVNPLENITFEEYMDEVTKRLKAVLPQYESREAQELMIHEVITALEQDKHLLIEAGTGTGKSLGYLLPAIYHSVKSDQKVMVSTHTINLQDQLRERDIPLLTSVVPFPFKASIFKGRGHYLCLRKFEHRMNKKDFTSPREEALTAAQMLVWLTQTTTGDDEELNLSGRGGDFWETVASDTDSCLGRACPWFRKCYYHRAKHEAGISDVVVTNHSKLFADVKAGHQLLPAYDHLVIDEAHHLEDIAGKHLGMQMKYFTFAHTLTRLYKDSRSGQLPALRQSLQSSGSEQASEWSGVIDRIYPDLLTVKESWDALSDRLFSLLPERSDAGAGEAGQLVARLQPGKKPKDWEELAALENTLNLSLSDIIRKGDKMLSEMRDTDSQSSSDSLVTDIGGLFKDLASIREQIRFFMSLNDENIVYWLEEAAIIRASRCKCMLFP